ncbi:response regulator transcription factor [uncultured Bacteroides sp.]|uniref:response regulator transcription factor n=1 Tax=uncultured Bacteroides sp. TaxID=162156 RepID=UPI00261924E9|nr:response regulator transcription factor [uncultured Bacteroides sp.]
MKKMILADNQAITAIGVKSLALQCDGYSGFVEVGNIHDLSVALAEYPDSAVVLDYTLFDCTADQLLVLKARFPESCLLLFSDSLSADFIRRMVFGGERIGVLMKDSELDEIQEALGKASEGNGYICRKVAAWLYGKETKNVVETDPLTATEKEILRAMALGKSTKEIAAERFLSVYTVMTHRKNIFRKLKVNNAHEAVRYALRAGIVNTMEYYI